MWLYLPVVGSIVVGIALTALGVAPVGIPLIAIAIGVLVFNVRQTRTPNEPKRVPGGYAETGHAHEGQKHMTL